MAKAIAVAGGRPEEKAQKVQQKDPQAPNQLTSFVERTGSFLKDVRNEMRKVVTPSRAEVQTTTAVVIGTVFAFAAFFAAVDYILTHAMQLLLHWLGSAQ
jgi:preprotein translocase subunit SecE